MTIIHPRDTGHRAPRTDRGEGRAVSAAMTASAESPSASGSLARNAPCPRRVVRGPPPTSPPGAKRAGSPRSPPQGRDGSEERNRVPCFPAPARPVGECRLTHVRVRKQCE